MLQHWYSEPVTDQEDSRKLTFRTQPSKHATFFIRVLFPVIITECC